MDDLSGIETEYKSVVESKQRYAKYTRRAWCLLYALGTVFLVIGHCGLLHSSAINGWEYRIPVYAEIGLILLAFHTCAIFFLLFSKRIQYCCFLTLLWANLYLLMLVGGLFFTSSKFSLILLTACYVLNLYSCRGKPHHCFCSSSLSWAMNMRDQKNNT